MNMEMVAPPVEGGAKPIDGLRIACADSTCHFKPMRFQRRPVGLGDVLFELSYCGVCHSDLHNAADHLEALGETARYPMTPGHELAGIVTQVGANVTKFKVGDKIGVGCFVDSCQNCNLCSEGSENDCKKKVMTYGGDDNGSGRAESFPKGKPTIGGYSTHMVVHESFGIVIPESYPLDCAGPVMCAGITMYDPLKKNGAKPGTRVGIIGLGGLGGMGIKIAKAMGCTVTAISRSSKKAELATKAGAHHFLASGDDAAMAKAANSLDLILNTIPGNHDWKVYQRLIADGGTHIMLGLNTGTVAAIVMNKKSIKASIIGGIQRTQEVIDLCAKAEIYPDIEVVPVQKIGEVYELLDQSNESGVRYVLDIKGTLVDSVLEKWETKVPEIKPVEGMGKCGLVKDMCRMVCMS